AGRLEPGDELSPAPVQKRLEFPDRQTSAERGNRNSPSAAGSAHSQRRSESRACRGPRSRSRATDDMISPAGSTIPLPQGIAKIVTCTDLQNCDAWKRAFQNRCKDHRYYEILEQTLDGDFEHRYLLLEDGSGNVRAIQPLFFVRQNPGE